MITFFQHLSRSLLPGFLIALIISGLLIRLLMGQSLTTEFDLSLNSRAQALMAITEQDEDGVELEVYPEALNRYFLDSEPDYFEIHNQSGLRLFYSESLAANETLEVASTESIDGIIDRPLPDGRSGRVIRQTYYPKIDLDDDESKRSFEQRTNKNSQHAFSASGVPVKVNGITVTPDEVTVTVATSRESLDHTLNQLNLILILTGVLTTSVVLVLQRRALGRAVRPLQEMSEQISKLGVERIDQNLFLSYPILELDVLKTQFNEMLGRLNAGFQRERRFSSDIAHEIRTPLAELRTMTEVMHRWPDDQNLKDSFHDDLLNTVERMERLIQNLLELSRSELGLNGKQGLVDLSALIPRVVASHNVEFSSRNLTVKTVIPDGFIFVKGCDIWPSILENLINNAATYSTPGSNIEIVLSRGDINESLELCISNDTSDIDEEDLHKLFDRLWRKDQSRTGGYHSGLGLSLVSMYATSVGFSVSAALDPPGRLNLKLQGLCEDQQDLIHTSNPQEAPLVWCDEQFN